VRQFVESRPRARNKPGLGSAAVENSDLFPHMANLFDGRSPAGAILKKLYTPAPLMHG
jgi:hypothetical protein